MLLKVRVEKTRKPFPAELSGAVTVNLNVVTSRAESALSKLLNRSPKEDGRLQIGVT